MLRLSAALILVIFAAWHSGVFGCQSTAMPKSSFDEVPGSILLKAREFIISRVGDKFYNEHITLDVHTTEFVPARENSGTLYERVPHYNMGYIFGVEGDSLMRSYVSFSLDLQGELIPDARIEGLPECKKFPEECLFPIDRDKAVEIATTHGLEDGLRDWRIRFTWDNGWETYVWTVWNTLWIASPEQLRKQRVRSRGRSLTIDANCGRIIEDFEWEEQIFFN